MKTKNVLTTILYASKFHSWFLNEEGDAYDENWCYKSVEALYNYYEELANEKKENLIITGHIIDSWAVLNFIDETEHFDEIDHSSPKVIKVPGSDKVIVKQTCNRI